MSRVVARDRMETEELGRQLHLGEGSVEARKGSWPSSSLLLAKEVLTTSGFHRGSRKATVIITTIHSEEEEH